MSVSSGSSGSTGPTTFVAAGSEGCVVKPAFPNNDGPHDRNVAKIFFKRGNAAEALTRNAELGSLGIEPSLFPYTRTFKGSNVPEPFRENCGIKNVENPIEVVRMPNLGVDFLYFIDQAKKPTDISRFVKQIKRLPLSQVLTNGVLHLFETILKLRKASAIHGDLRFENVMLDPVTGTFTLIDYGKLVSDKDIMTHSIGTLLYHQFPPEMMFWLSAQYEQVRNRYETAKAAAEAAVEAAAEAADETEAEGAAANKDAADEALALVKQNFKLNIEKYKLQRDHWLDYLYTNGKKYEDLDESQKRTVRRAFIPSYDRWVFIYSIIISYIRKYEKSSVVVALKRIASVTAEDPEILIGNMFRNVFDRTIQRLIEEGVTTREGFIAGFKKQSINTIDSYGAALCVLLFFDRYFDDNDNWRNCPTEVRQGLYHMLINMIAINYKDRREINDELIGRLRSFIDEVKAQEAAKSSSAAASATSEEGPSSSSAASKPAEASASSSSSSSSSAASSAVKRVPSSGGRRAKKLKSRRRCPVRRRKTHRK